MPELYIIGNGFDKEHGLKTSYWNFREYLEKYEEDFLVQMERMYDFAPFERKDHRNRKNKQCQKWRDDALYQYLWQSFEFDLSHANEVEMEERSQSVLEVMDLDGGLIGIEDTNQQINVHRDFFHNLVDIIGYSMSEVDLPYFQTVQLYSSEKTVWNIYYYDKDEQDSMKERLLSIGVMKEEIYMRDAKEFWDKI